MIGSYNGLVSVCATPLPKPIMTFYQNTIRNKRQWNLDQIKLSSQWNLRWVWRLRWNAADNFVCKISTILFRSQCVNVVTISLTAQPHLEFDSRYRNMTIPSGGAIKINVSLEGHPAPHVTWYHDGVPMSSRGPNASVDTNEYSSVMTVRRAFKDDEGEYRVVAKNEWGSVEASFDVSIMGESYGVMLRQMTWF